MSARLIVGFLNMVNDVIPKGYKGLGGYKSLAEFLLKNGREFTPQPLPPGFAKMKIGNCYQNAAQLALIETSLTYCEGYAAGCIPVPVQHAWCCLPDGKVIDPTWEPRRGRKVIRGEAYFGIPIKTSYLLHRLARQKTYGIIDRWEDDWPMLKDSPRRWQARL